jgi:RNA recognition motif-containing protein
MKKIYVANISFNVTEQDIRDLFSEYGEIESVKMITDKYTGQSRGFAFIEMGTENDAKKAISELNGKTFMGRTLTVAEARPQQKRHGLKDRTGGYGDRGIVPRKGW